MNDGFELVAGIPDSRIYAAGAGAASSCDLQYLDLIGEILKRSGLARQYNRARLSGQSNADPEPIRTHALINVKLGEFSPSSDRNLAGIEIVIHPEAPLGPRIQTRPRIAWKDPLNARFYHPSILRPGARDVPRRKPIDFHHCLLGHLVPITGGQALGIQGTRAAVGRPPDRLSHVPFGNGRRVFIDGGRPSGNLRSRRSLRLLHGHR